MNTFLRKLFNFRSAPSTPIEGVPTIPRKASQAEFHPVVLKKGKWVVHQGRPAIVNDISLYPSIGIMVVNDVGENLMQLIVPLGSVSVASLGEIPEARRPTQERGNALGYF